MKRYNPTEIEPKWQKIWADDHRYRAVDFDDKPKFYVTGMFPYPSGAGMHTGHFFEHSIVDAVARYHRAQGQNVMYPMGFDNFGLPAENYAIKTGVSPQQATRENMANFKNQLDRVGASIDWSREVRTSDPEYYRWTQWIFTKLFERGLAYQKESPQWWCEIDQTVLANEQVINGKCWRHDGPSDPPAVKKNIRQWFFKITDYADQLLEEIPALEWPDKIKTAQTNWIGRSHGSKITWQVVDEGGADSGDTLEVYTTRTDTLPGVTFIVVAPESPEITRLTRDEDRDMVADYIKKTEQKSDIERSGSKEKTGVPTGKFAKNPLTGAVVPIFAADYVLGGYGTGIVMGMSGHDERDFEFAEKFHLPIIKTSEPPKESDYDYDGIWTGKNGTQINSGEKYDGRPNSEVAALIQEDLIENGVAESSTQYKMRDWLISRQRYWGAPIPIIHCEEHGAVSVPDDQLPVILPQIKDFAPKGDGKSPLARVESWVNTTCPTCGKPAKRETDVMDGYACSSWYLLRYADSHDDKMAWNPELANYWQPVDMYVGGDHAVAHLLYVRFWNHVFYDMGLVPTKEPVKQLVYHGLIQAEDGSKMSKSKGNVVDPLEVIDAGYGADALRTFELFLGPINENSAWSSRGIAGVYRFLNRFWTLTQEFIDSDKQGSPDAVKLNAITHATIKKVTSDYERLSFNTAVAALMEAVNELYKLKTDGFSESWRQSLLALTQLLQPFAPHMAAELWQQLGEESMIDFAAWPVADESKIVSDTMTIIVQVNGKLRAKLDLSVDATEDEIKAMALSDENVQKFIGDIKPTKVIYIPGRLVNVVV